MDHFYPSQAHVKGWQASYVLRSFMTFPCSFMALRFSFSLSVKGQSLGSYQVSNSPAHPDPLRWWKMVLEDEKMNLEVSFSVIDQFCSQDLLYLYHSITRFLWFDMMTAYILVSSRYLRRLPFQLSCQRLHPPPNTMLRPPQFPTLLPHCPCQPPSHL